MCGIIGYIGKRQAKKVLLKSLAKLEYRGYDSAGIAVLNKESHVVITKSIGKVANLEVMCTDADATEEIEDAGCGIGHTRWATHGGVTNTNAHPHQQGRIVLIHNGIIENFRELIVKFHLENQLVSETDTEVVAAIFNY